MNYSTSQVWITALLVALCVAVLQTENCVQNVLQATQFSVICTINLNVHVENLENHALQSVVILEHKKILWIFCSVKSLQRLFRAFQTSRMLICILDGIQEP